MPSSVAKLKSYPDDFPRIDADTLLELLRELRQETTSLETQRANAIEIDPCIQLLTSIVSYLEGGGTENVIDKFVLSVCARVAVQFVGNAIVENDDNQKMLWIHSDSLKRIFRYKDTKLKNYTAMVYYNLMLSQSHVRDEMLNDSEFMDLLLDEAILGFTEFPQFILEKFLELNYFDRLYPERKPLHKQYILDLIPSLVKNKSIDFIFDAKHIEVISSAFVNQADTILNGGKDREEVDRGSVDEREANCQREATQDPGLAVKLLSTLCCLSSSDKHNKTICDNTSLLINTIYLLRAMSEAAGSENGTASTATAEGTIGFKADLVRFIGNLCWKHKKNQDLVREHKCIPLILNCCKLDETNPFICEWAIMAIRNLCEDNQENQDAIASLKRLTETDIVAMSEQIRLLNNDQNSL